MPRGAVETKLGGASIAFLDNAPGHRPVDALRTRVLPCNAAPGHLAARMALARTFSMPKVSSQFRGSKGKREASIPRESVSGGHFGKNPSIQLFPLNAKFP